MKRPFFLFFMGLVLGEAAAISLNRTGFFVMALFLFILILIYFGLYQRIKRKRSPLFIYAIIFYGLFFAGGLLLLRAEYPDTADQILAKREIDGTLSGNVEFVKKTAEGEYQLTLSEVSFWEEGKGSLKHKKGSYFLKNYKLRAKCRILKIKVSEKEIYPGDQISCTGKLSAIKEASNPGEFDARTYYYSLGIRYQFFGKAISRKKERPLSVYRMAGRVRERMDTVYRYILSENEYGLLKAMFLGDKTELSSEEKRLYEENGVAHLLAVSGLHVSIVGGMLFRFLRKRKFSYAVSCVCSSFVLLFYAIMTGFGNSVFRAVIMFLIFLLAQYFGAEYDMVSSMSLAGILMLYDSPLRILESGCIISFTSIFAIGMIVPFVKELEEKRRRSKLIPGEFLIESKWKKRIRQAFFTSIIISMVIGPLLLRFYYQWSPYSVLLNLFVIPAMSPLLLSAITGGVMGLFQLWAGMAGCIPAVLLLRGFHVIFQFIHKMPGAVIVTGCPSWWKILLFYLAELCLFICWYYRLWSAGCVFILILIAGRFCRPVPPLQISMLDVGQGECIFLKTPANETVLIDGGSTSKKHIADYTILPALKYYGTDHLDYVIITHTDEDHISGIRELLEEEYPVKNIILPDTLAMRLPEQKTEKREVQEKDRESKKTMLEVVKKSNANVVKISKGDIIKLDRIRLSCLHPVKGWDDEDVNSGSIVFALSYEKFTMLFTGDLPGEQEALFMKEVPTPVSVLKTAHHGSKNSTTDLFLKMVHPQKAILSAGKNNLYGHPHKETIKRLQKNGADIYGTLWGGAIHIESNGQKYQINYFKKSMNTRNLFL